MGMTQQFFAFWSLVTLTFEFGRDFCTTYLTTKFDRLTFSRLEVIVQTNKHNDKQANKLECGPMPNVMAALPNIGGAFCSTPQSLADAHYWSAVQ